jgi:hypothetical protein
MLPAAGIPKQAAGNLESIQQEGEGTIRGNGNLACAEQAVFLGQKGQGKLIVGGLFRRHGIRGKTRAKEKDEAEEYAGVR